MFRDMLPAMRSRSLETRRPMSIADLMEDFWAKPFETAATKGMSFPAMDISEDEKAITVKAELPGIETKDVDVNLEHGVLTIRGEKKFEDEEKKDNYHRIERSYGSFSRALQVPGEVDETKVEAKFDKGILTITLPKNEKAKPKKIEIKS